VFWVGDCWFSDRTRAGRTIWRFTRLNLQRPSLDWSPVIKLSEMDGYEFGVSGCSDAMPTSRRLEYSSSDHRLVSIIWASGWVLLLL